MPRHYNYDPHIECITYSIRQFVTWGIYYMGIKRTNKRASKTAVAKKSVVTTVESVLVIDQHIAANPNAPIVDVGPGSAPGARNRGRFTGWGITTFQRWVMRHCVSDQRTDREIAARFTAEHPNGSAAQNGTDGVGNFPVSYVGSIRRDFNDGAHDTAPSYPTPEWKLGADGSRIGTVRFRAEPEPGKKRGRLLDPVPYDPPA